MQICFNNSSRLSKKQYYSNYKGIKFKLIQNNPKKWSDVLISIIDTHFTPPSLNIQEDIFLNASEFLSALSWQHNSLVKIWSGGGIGSNKKLTLRNAKCNFYDFPKISCAGNTGSYNIDIIPFIENDIQRNALYLYREALSSNNIYLSCLFYWHILELKGGSKTIGWINKTINKNLNKVRIPHHYFADLNIKSKKLGTYLHDDCRNAIAHINRYKDKTTLKFDSLSDIRRITISKNIIEKLAHYFILTELKLNKKFYLENKLDFPVFKIFNN